MPSLYLHLSFSSISSWSVTFVLSFSSSILPLPLQWSYFRVYFSLVPIVRCSHFTLCTLHFYAACIPLDLFFLSFCRDITQDNSKTGLKVRSKILSAELPCHKIRLLSFSKFNYQSRRHCLLLQAMLLSPLKHWMEVEKKAIALNVQKKKRLASYSHLCECTVCTYDPIQLQFINKWA